MTRSPAPRRLRRNTVRARIAFACAGLFLVVGGILIAATYGIVGHISDQAQTAINLADQPYQRLQSTCEDAQARGTLAQDRGLARKCRVELHTLAEQITSAQRGTDRRQFLVYSLVGLGLTTVVAGVLGWAVSGRILRPLRSITEAARAAS